MKTNLLRAIAKNGAVFASAIDSKNIVSEMQRLHSTSAAVSAALGRTLTAASLMGAQLKNSEDSLTLRINGGGPIGSIIAVSDSGGNVRGCCGDYTVEPPLNKLNKLDVGGVVGSNGMLTVIKDIGLKEPYVGSVQQMSGEIGEDVTRYYAESEQTPTVCALGVLVDTDFSIKAAGGFIAQLMPGASEDDIKRLEDNIKDMPAVTQLLSGGFTPEMLAMRVLGGFEPEVIDRSFAEYRCNCSEQKTIRALASIPKKELLEIIEQDGKAEVICSFCNKAYRFDKNQLQKIYEGN